MKIEFNYNNQKELEKDKEELSNNRYVVTNNVIIIDDDYVIENCLDFINVLCKLNLDRMTIGDKEIGELIRKLLIIHNRIILSEELNDG